MNKSEATAAEGSWLLVPNKSSPKLGPTFPNKQPKYLFYNIGFFSNKNVLHFSKCLSASRDVSPNNRVGLLVSFLSLCPFLDCCFNWWTGSASTSCLYRCKWVFRNALCERLLLQKFDWRISLRLFSGMVRTKLWHQSVYLPFKKNKSHF